MGKQEHFDEQQEVLEHLLRAEREARRRVEQAREEADRITAETREQAEARVDRARREAEAEAEQLLRKAREASPGKGKQAPRAEAAGARTDLDTLQREARENMERTVDYLVDWVTGAAE